tara:strand:+ start:343 stop:1692 length:1350 start_codon:yes stop_codon:yes gene_type:complete
LFKKKSFILGSLAFTGLIFNTSVYPSVLKNSHKEVIDHVWQIIYKDFLDSEGNFSKSDWILLRKDLLAKKYSNSVEAYEAIRVMLSNLKDPYTRFLDPKQFNQMRIDTSGELTGIGIQIIKDDKIDALLIVTPIEGSPASEAGIKAKDKIISIDNISTKGMNIDEAVRLIRGKVGTKVKLGISRNGNKIYKSLLRQKIEIKSVKSRINNTKEGFLIGYIRIKQFNANASREMKGALMDFENKKIAGYVLDLRNNPGGLLDSSIEISRHFINDGIIVSTVSKNGLKDTKKANGSAITKKPLVVLVNEASASASEIVSGAIRDNQRGKLVGKKTYGKGLVQSMRTLIDGSGLTVTVAKYLTPNGIDINKFGITPDIEVNMNKRILSRDIGTKKDNQYKAGESELIKLIRKKNSYNTFNPMSKNLEAVFDLKYQPKVPLLNRAKNSYPAFSL